MDHPLKSIYYSALKSTGPQKAQFPRTSYHMVPDDKLAPSRLLSTFYAVILKSQRRKERDHDREHHTCQRPASP